MNVVCDSFSQSGAICFTIDKKVDPSPNANLCQKEQSCFQKLLPFMGKLSSCHEYYHNKHNTKCSESIAVFGWRQYLVARDFSLSSFACDAISHSKI